MLYCIVYCYIVLFKCVALFIWWSTIHCYSICNDGFRLWFHAFHSSQWYIHGVTRYPQGISYFRYFWINSSPINFHYFVSTWWDHSFSKWDLYYNVSGSTHTLPSPAPLVITHGCIDNLMLSPKYTLEGAPKYHIWQLWPEAYTDGSSWYYNITDNL